MTLNVSWCKSLTLLYQSWPLPAAEQELRRRLRLRLRLQTSCIVILCHLFAWCQCILFSAMCLLAWLTNDKKKKKKGFVWDNKSYARAVQFELSAAKQNALSHNTLYFQTSKCWHMQNTEGLSANTCTCPSIQMEWLYHSMMCSPNILDHESMFSAEAQTLMNTIKACSD